MTTMRSEPELERALTRLHRSDREAIEEALADVNDADRATAQAFVRAATRPAAGARRTSHRAWLVAAPLAAMVVAGIFVLAPGQDAPEATSGNFLGHVDAVATQELVAGQPFDLPGALEYGDRAELEFYADAAGSEFLGRLMVHSDPWHPTEADLATLPIEGWVSVRPILASDVPQSPTTLRFIRR